MSHNRTPRLLNAAVGLLLLVSAFSLPYTRAQLTNTWVVGALCVATALTALTYPLVRYGNSLLALWLLGSAWTLSSESQVAVWANTIGAIAMFALSLAPMTPPTMRGAPSR